MKKTTKPKVTQSQRFIEAAREAGASEDEAVFDEALRRLVKPASPAPSPARKPQKCPTRDE